MSSCGDNGCPGSVHSRKLSQLMYTRTFPLCISAVSCDGEEGKSTSSIHQVTLITTAHSHDCFSRSSGMCLTRCLLDPQWHRLRRKCERTVHAVQLLEVCDVYVKNRLKFLCRLRYHGCKQRAFSPGAVGMIFIPKPP